jgi:hypothetical protein
MTFVSGHAFIVINATTFRLAYGGVAFFGLHRLDTFERDIMRRFWWAIGITIIVAFADSARSDDQADAKTIIEKAIKALEADKKAQTAKATSWKARGKFYVGDNAISVDSEWHFQQPDQLGYKLDLDASGRKIKIVTVLNGAKAWEKVDDKPGEISKERLAAMQHEAYLCWVLCLTPLGEAGFKLTPLGESKVEKRPVLGIKVVREGKGDVTAYFDKESSQLVKAQTRFFDESSMKEVSEERILSGYKKVGGKQHYTKMKVLREGNLMFDLEIYDQKVLAKLEDSVFGKP